MVYVKPLVWLALAIGVAAGQVQQPLPSFRGVLKQMDDKSISLEMGDFRVLDFTRNSKTAFFKNGKEVKSPKFAAGDQILIEGQKVLTGELVAVKVHWEKAAADVIATPAGVTVDAWADPPGATPPPRKAVEQAPPPAKPDPDDPGPPPLRRGRPADPARQRADPVPAEEPRAPITNLPVTPPAAARVPPVRRVDDDDASPAIRRVDDLIRRAADAALDFTVELPAYICQEVMTRYQSATKPAKWEPIDVVTANLVYENGKEDYRDITVGGKRVDKKMEEIGGAWSTGEFGTVLRNLFSPATAADFRYSKDSRIAGLTAKLYTFDVQRERSDWVVHAESQTYMPAYRGSVWIDPQTARVLRVEMQGYGFPRDFPVDVVESVTEYQYTRLGDLKQYLLPVHSETLSCQRGASNCYRNTIDFRNYRKFTGESTITYEPKDK